MKGRVIWITGLSGAGKTTLATRLCELLWSRGFAPLLLDGDKIRAAIGDRSCGHDRESRLENAWRICRLARLAAEQGHVVVVATMSLFHEVHAWNRDHLPHYVEIFLDAGLEAVTRRDPKNLYGKAECGLERNLPGVDLTPEFPLAPHMRLDNSQDLEDPTPLAMRLYEAFF